MFVFVPSPYVSGTWQLCPEKWFALLIQFAKVVNVMELVPQAMAPSPRYQLSRWKEPQEGSLVLHFWQIMDCAGEPREFCLNPIEAGVGFLPKLGGAASFLADKNPKDQIWCSLVRSWVHNLIHHSEE